MAVEAFISFISKEIANKMAKALVKAAIYGNGTNKSTGAIYNLVAVEGVDPIDTIVKTYKALAEDFRIGAKAYISTNVNIDIVGYKDDNGNYPFLNGVSATKLVPIEVEPFLENGDIITGNPENYIQNTVEDVTVVRESHVVGRKTTYGAYGMFDGKPRPGAFAKGSYVAETTSI
jgi:HK97 family phage major capsid protein